MEINSMVVPGDRAGEVSAMLRGLTTQEAQVIRMRFGLGTRRRSSTEIGVLLGRTRGQVERMELRALRRLREHSAGIGAAPGALGFAAMVTPQLRLLAGGRVAPPVA